MCKGRAKFGLLLSCLLLPVCVQAQEASGAGDGLFTLWIGLCSALVLIMQSGFLLLEGGLVRSKNAINVILKNLTDIGIGTVGYWILGFGLMFGANSTGWFGASGFMPSPAGSEDSVNLLYQFMFAATAATIISGSLAERVSFMPYIFGALFVTSFIYPIFGSWAWGGEGDQLGWLNALGFHDMAGGAVVHAIGGWCALGALIVVGPRTGRYSRKGEVNRIPGHSLPYVALGGFVLWFGWFGFNGGSAARDFSNLGQILLNTHFGAIGGICGAILTLTLLRRGFLMTHIVNGMLGGLVSVTAGADVMSTGSALIVGVFAGVLVVVSRNVLHNFKVDDVVGAVSVHGFCGSWGVLAVALFYQGDAMNVERIITQIVGVSAAFVWAFTMSFLTFWALSKVVALRVSTRVEQRGLDISEHKEIGYNDFMTNPARSDY